jgi:superfamily II DNA or RNA helicase
VDGALRLEPAEIVRARIAEVVLETERPCAQLGAIRLKPHQQSAVARIEEALEEFGGALLCDDVGMGKTFVATAVARGFSGILTVAPAALASMWRDALATTGTRSDFVTFERLSRTAEIPTARRSYDLVIVDEAHHARNPATRRYRNLADMAREARIILLTATPIHNRTEEMLALLSLFLGSRARTLTPGELSRCIVRRERDALPHDVAIPIVTPVVHREVADNPAIVEELMALPPPIPFRDGGLGGALIGRGLVHQWASSEAALREAVRRRIAKAVALIASLETGNYPTARELETWTYSEGALQLGFPDLLSSITGDARSLLDVVRSHSAALHEFHARHRDERALDDQRIDILAEILRTHPSAKIVAFAQYAETVSMLFSRLANVAGTAMLTARGGVVAGGKLTRDDVLARFAPLAFRAESPSQAEKIDLLLTTDLLSEGVNLQDAGVVVHLDVPWTAARLEQRVGRVARMGSLRERVHVYLLCPPASAAALLRSERLVHEKWTKAKRAIGSSAAAPFSIQAQAENQSALLESIPAKTERLRAILGSWRRPHSSLEFHDVAVASVQSQQSGFMAAVSIRDEPLLISCVSDCVSAELDSLIAACLSCGTEEMETGSAEYGVAENLINRWFEHYLASTSAGVADSRSHTRKRLLDRIESAIQRAPPHLRSKRSRAAARARIIATSQHGPAIEAELELLARSPLPDHEWLEAFGRVQSTPLPKHRVASSRATLRIHAVLLMHTNSL